MKREPFDLFDDDERGFDYEALLGPTNFDDDAAEIIAARESLRPVAVIHLGPRVHHIRFGSVSATRSNDNGAIL